MLPYLIILSTTVAGMMQAPAWVILACACTLALLSLVERRGTTTSPMGHEAGEPFAALASLLNGTAAASAAFLLGRATAWLWGI